MHLSMKSRARGFSLIEVLVALLVVSIGLLGIAKMQALALSNTNGGRLRALAAIEAQSLKATMEAERTYWGNLPAAVTVSIVGTPGANWKTPGSTLITSTDTTQSGTVTCALPGSTSATAVPLCTGPVVCTSTTSPCTAQQMAAYDLQQWSGRVQQLLGAYAASINCTQLTTTVQVSCLVTLNWAENQVNSNSSETGSMATPSYSLPVNP
jgi:type IV pilus assembly protein PilV